MVEDLPDEGDEDAPVATPVPIPGQFTLRYEPNLTMNPITALNRDNILLASLLYESLFILDVNLNAVPLLCVSWHTEDNVEFTFEIMPNVVMHDESILTADDVAYSIRQAMRRGRHINKLRTISDVAVEDELTVSITLNSPNARFIRLLDIPIIKSGTIDERVPPGTGPYVFPGPDTMWLNRFPRYRHYMDLPLTMIRLLECNDSDITSLFDEGRLSLLWDDPAGAFDIRINRPHEPRYYNTTALQYLGFNADSLVLRNSDVRRAIGCSIERQYIVENIMNVPRTGQTVAAPIAISPIFNMYDPRWEQRFMDPLDEMGALLERAGLRDANEDGFLEIPDGFGGYREFTIDFIVNIENSHKLAAAHRIAENLRQFGLDINVRELQWGNFMAALEDGAFDMYYGETLLGADFDFSPLLLPGEDNLNFGRTANTAFKPLIDSFLAARTAEEVSYAGALLFGEITASAPFVPILYKRYAIHSSMGSISGATPGQSGVFHNFHDWSVDLYMLN
jgi:peptide/nickel transport system substrate-binding protein